MNIIDEVIAERQRQIDEEGWTTDNDDHYELGELASAAGCYALSSGVDICNPSPRLEWPFHFDWWKPTTNRRNLVKAAALIIAEIERLDRI